MIRLCAFGLLTAIYEYMRYMRYYIKRTERPSVADGSINPLFLIICPEARSQQMIRILKLMMGRRATTRNQVFVVRLTAKQVS